VVAPAGAPIERQERSAAQATGEAMRTRSLAIRAGISGAITVALLVVSAMSRASGGAPPQVTDLLTRPLADVPGKEVTMITVDYPPGGKDPVHRHDASAFIYVLEGTIEMQMEGAEKVTLHPGQTFYEDPKGVHLVGRNTSDTEPAKFVVFLVKNRGAPILIPVDR
jgi:quercetin dioxygenase-like cupin family protein